MFAARISGVQRFGLFVTVRDSGASGLVPMSGLPDDFWLFDEKTQTLSGRRTGTTWHLAQEVDVRLQEASPVTGGMIFRMAGPARSDQASRRRQLPGGRAGPPPSRPQAEAVRAALAVLLLLVPGLARAASSTTGGAARRLPGGRSRPASCRRRSPSSCPGHWNRFPCSSSPCGASVPAGRAGRQPFHRDPRQRRRPDPAPAPRVRAPSCRMAANSAAWGDAGRRDALAAAAAGLARGAAVPARTGSPPPSSTSCSTTSTPIPATSPRTLRASTGRAARARPGVGMTVRRAGNAYVVSDLNADGPAADGRHPRRRPPAGGGRPAGRRAKPPTPSTTGSSASRARGLSLTVPRPHRRHARTVELERAVLPPETVFATRHGDLLLIRISGLQRRHGRPLPARAAARPRPPAPARQCAASCWTCAATAAACCGRRWQRRPT